MITIDPEHDRAALAELRSACLAARRGVALSGAGISVASGIADFRSPGGLWSVFDPGEYATLQAFQDNPAMAWRLYRALGRELADKQPNPAHTALADLERAGLLAGVVTQNVDNLHQAAGSRTVVEIHGDHHHLHCLQCTHLEPVREEHYEGEDVPTCPHCGYPLKPNVVLFGEPVRQIEQVELLLDGCDLLYVVGTSAQVYPAAGLPLAVKQGGGLIVEFNHVQSLGSMFGGNGSEPVTDYFISGDAAITLPLLVETLVQP